MDFHTFNDGAVIAGMTIDDLSPEARIFNLRGYSPFHLMAVTGSRTWEYRVNSNHGGKHVWQTWQINNLAWSAEHGDEITQEYARRLIDGDGYDPALIVQEGL